MKPVNPAYDYLVGASYTIAQDLQYEVWGNDFKESAFRRSVSGSNCISG